MSTKQRLREKKDGIVRMSGKGEGRSSGRKLEMPRDYLRGVTVRDRDRENWARGHNVTQIYAISLLLFDKTLL